MEQDPVFRTLVNMVNEKIQAAGVNMMDHRAVWEAVLSLRKFASDSADAGTFYVRSERGAITDVILLRQSCDVWMQYPSNVQNCPEDIKQRMRQDDRAYYDITIANARANARAQRKMQRSGGK